MGRCSKSQLQARALLSACRHGRWMERTKSVALLAKMSSASRRPELVTRGRCSLRRALPTNSGECPRAATRLAAPRTTLDLGMSSAVFAVACHMALPGPWIVSRARTALALRVVVRDLAHSTSSRSTATDLKRAVKTVGKANPPLATPTCATECMSTGWGPETSSAVRASRRIRTPKLVHVRSATSQAWRCTRCKLS